MRVVASYILGTVLWVSLIADVARADVVTSYAAYSSSTNATKTDWRYGYSDTRGFVGNSAKTQAVALMVAYHAYSEENLAREELWKLGLLYRRGFSMSMGVADAQAIVVSAANGSMIMVGIRGTAGIRDGITDIYFAPTLVNNSGVDLHKGFSNYVDTLYESVRAELAPDCVSGGKAIWITGHSLGGAAATIMAARLERSGCHISGVATFGSPRAGLETWLTEYINSSPVHSDLYYRTQRWVHDKDPIYCAAPGGQWEHVGLEGLLKDTSAPMMVNRYFGSTCENPTGWLNGIREAIRVSPEARTFQFSAAANAWISGAVSIAFMCQPGFGWDDVWSLGNCFLVDAGNTLRNGFGISPEDLISEIFRFTNLNDHWKDKYRERIVPFVNFDDNTAIYQTSTGAFIPN